MRRRLTTLFLLVTTGWALAVGTPAWKSVDGPPANPLRNPGKRAAVLFFIASDCPNSNGYAPEFNAIDQTLQGRSVAFYVVHEDEGLSVSDARRHTHDYGFTCPVLLDPQHTLAHQLGATVTPEVAVLDATGHILYRGRIDDRYVSCGSSRQLTTHDLRDALDAVLAGRPVPHPETPAAGCAI